MAAGALLAAGVGTAVLPRGPGSTAAVGGAGNGYASTTGCSTARGSAAGCCSEASTAGRAGVAGGNPSSRGSTRKGVAPCARAAPGQLTASVPAKVQQKIKVSGLRWKGSFIPLRVSDWYFEWSVVGTWSARADAKIGQF